MFIDIVFRFMDNDNNDYLESYNDGDDYNDLLFYTPKIIQQIDDADIIREIFARYPKLKESNESKKEKDERKAFADFLQERELVNEILNKYNLTIIELVKLFYRKFSYIFNTITYSNKLRKIIELNEYRTEIK